ncbi:MAG: hypothetical protein GXZ11_03975 [Tissierellia bacterium]|nr:hypothetical protein [Tissierellia bacterium]
MFARRLDLLMEITSTKASSLGKACSIDASYVSRLRRGDRALPKKPSFLTAMSTYLAKQIKEEWQQKSICEALHISGDWEDFESNMPELILNWLISSENSFSQVEPMLMFFSNSSKQQQTCKFKAVSLPPLEQYYYGKEGKQLAVLQFFSKILREDKPRTIYLFSDEDTSWMFENPVFTAQWSKMFIEVLKRGNKVKIVHTINRNIHEMIEAVAKWTPIYMTGMVEPYYYPKIRDGLFQRTLFLARGTAAIVSSSVKGDTNRMLNELITDSDAIDALLIEFQNYFSLCLPLMQILTPGNIDKLLEIHNLLAESSSDMICLTNGPTIQTMPEYVADSIQKRFPNSHIKKIWDSLSSSWKLAIESCKYIEILPSYKVDMPKCVPLNSAVILGDSNICYTRDEYIMHYDYLKKLQSKYPNYKPLYQDTNPKPLLPNLLLFAKENVGVVLSKTDSPAISFVFNDPNLTTAYWEYLSSLVIQLSNRQN